MNFKMEINLDNEAFGLMPYEIESEVKRIFAFYIDRLDLTQAGGMAVKDINGNTVGVINTEEGD